MEQEGAFGSVLTRYKEERAYSLERLARDSGVLKQTIEKWLDGTVATPGADSLLKVAAALRLNRVRLERLLRAARLPTLPTLQQSPALAKHRHLWASLATTAPHNLPAELNRFVGREAATLDVAEALCRPETRLVSLLGTGGSGKSRLALRVARLLLDTFEDGVYVVDLAPLDDPLLVVPRVAQVLGIAENPGTDLLDQLQARLRATRTLLLLDNVERVLAAGPALGQLLRATAELTILTTSRAPLRIYGEAHFPIDPLAVPDAGADFAAIRRSEAVRLFEERAKAARPSFAVTGENAAAVAQLCAQLDGLPLAIELAAARARHLAPHDLLARFPDRLALADDGPRDAPERQRTVRATVAWSEVLLDVGKRALFARLAAFSGGWTGEAAASVCGDIGGATPDIAGDLAALTDAHLVVPQGPEGAPRYTMLETIREYAAERLAASGEEASIRARHADWCLALAASAGRYVVGVKQPDWLARLERERDNLRAALAWARDRDDRLLLARLVGAAWPFWHENAHYGEGGAWLRAALDRADRLPSALRAPLELGALALTFSEGDFERAALLGAAALASWRALADDQGLAEVHLYRALVAQNRGDWAAARDEYERSIAHWREIDEPAGLLGCLSHLAFALAQYRDFAGADERYDEIVALCEAHGDRAGIARVHIDRGLSVMMRGDFARARALIGRGLALSRELDHPQQVPAALCYLGLATLLDGAPDEAFGYLAESLRLRRDAGEQFGVVYCLIGIAGVANKRRQPVRAARLCGAATALQAATGAVIAPGPRSLYEAELQQVRAQLDPAAFDAAWDEGLAMPLDRAIDYALAGAAV